MQPRTMTRPVRVGNLTLGGGNPIRVQSMTNTPTADLDATLGQIRRLEAEGCEIVRVAVPDFAAAQAIPALKAGIHIPLVADIHYDHRLALAALAGGVDKLRLNPGNIGDETRIRQVAAEARARGVPIRIGVNSGSLEDDILAKHGAATAPALVESALRHVGHLERHGFGDICISLKASSVPVCIEAYRLVSQQVDYPLHVGVTEAGTQWAGSIKSSVGIGAILALGIGDTIRVSLTADPCEEVRCGFEILKVLHLREWGVEFISCPTCGRTGVDMIPLARRVEERCRNVRGPGLTVAVMGCPVNAIKEGKAADLGVACGNARGGGFLFRKGEKIRENLAEDQLYPAFEQEFTALCRAMGREDGEVKP